MARAGTPAVTVADGAVIAPRRSTTVTWAAQDGSGRYEAARRGPAVWSRVVLPGQLASGAGRAQASARLPARAPGGAGVR